MKAGLSLHSGACLAGKTGAQGSSCVQLARVTGSSTTSNKEPGPTSLSQALFPGDRKPEASVADSGQDPVSTEKGNSRGNKSSSSFQRVRPQQGRQTLHSYSGPQKPGCHPREIREDTTNSSVSLLALGADSIVQGAATAPAIPGQLLDLLPPHSHTESSTGGVACLRLCGLPDFCYC